MGPVTPDELIPGVLPAEDIKKVIEIFDVYSAA